MRLKQKEFVIPVKKGHSDLLAHISAPDTFSFGADIPVRFAITDLSDQGYKCEIGLIENPEERFCENSLDLFQFSWCLLALVQILGVTLGMRPRR